MVDVFLFENQQNITRWKQESNKIKIKRIFNAKFFSFLCSNSYSRERERKKERDRDRVCVIEKIRIYFM